jgi:aryl-alcohol dehydrogenase-like predicted oxidoreductase
MNYRKMGKSGLSLSRIGLGSWYTLGTAVEEESSLAVLRTAYEEGINFFDTANVYTRNWSSGGGDVERLLGRFFKDKPRSSFVVLTKVCGKMGPGPNDRGLGYKHLIEQCHGSLRRLGLDHIDIYMCHRPDPVTPVDETVRAMEHLAQQGKILYWGVSNWAAWRIIKAQAIARETGARPMTVNQPRYNLLYRFAEHELFPATLDEGIGHAVYSPLAQGMLTGKYRPGEPPPEGSRAADEHDSKYMKMLYLDEENKARCAELVKIAAEMGAPPANLAIAWTLHHPQVTSAIIGAKRPEQVRENVKAAGMVIPPEVKQRLEELFPLRSDVWIGEAEIPTLV